MGEIKSTLEIALEKAKAMEISPEDRERFKKEEILSVAREIFQAHMNHSNKSVSLMKEIRKKEKDTSAITYSLTEMFIEALDLTHSSERIWQGLQELGLKDADHFREILAGMKADNAQARQQAAQKVGEEIRECLSESGISGTAVDPNIEGSPRWTASMQSLDARFSSRLENFRKEISRAIEGHSSSPR